MQERRSVPSPKDPYDEELSGEATSQSPPHRSPSPARSISTPTAEVTPPVRSTSEAYPEPRTREKYNSQIERAPAPRQQSLGQTEGPPIYRQQMPGTFKDNSDEILSDLREKITHMDKLLQEIQQKQPAIRSEVRQALASHIQALENNSKSFQAALRAESHGEIQQISDRISDENTRLRAEVASLQAQIDYLERRLAHDSDKRQAGEILSALLRKLLEHDTHVEAALTALPEQFFGTGRINGAVYQEVQQLKNHFVGINAVLGALQGVVAKSTSDIGASLTERLERVQEKSVGILQEFEEYERYYVDKQAKVTFPPINIDPTSPYAIPEMMAWAIRTAMQKMDDPSHYFTEKIDRLVREDLVMIIDLCDGFPGKEQLEEPIQRLMQQANLQEVTPEVNTSFDSRSQEIAGYTDMVSRYQIYKVDRRGFRYKGKTVRNAKVTIGR